MKSAILAILFVAFMTVIVIPNIYKYLSKREEAKNAKAKQGVKTDKNENNIVLSDREKERLTQIGKLTAVLNAYSQAQKGKAEAMAFLGTVYNYDLNNPKKSFLWMEKAANKGYAEALYVLGTYYGTGYGVEANKTRGCNYILQAAQKGDKDAIHWCSKSMSREEMRNLGIPV